VEKHRENDQWKNYPPLRFQRKFIHFIYFYIIIVVVAIVGRHIYKKMSTCVNKIFEQFSLHVFSIFRPEKKMATWQTLA